MSEHNAIHKHRNIWQISEAKCSFYSKKMHFNTSIAHRLGHNHRKYWIYLFVIIFIDVIATNKSNAARSILQSTNDVMTMDGINIDDHITESHFHLSDGKILKRDKRFLLFTGGGIAKSVLGFLAPVETRDRVNWRTLNLAYNFQAQYVPIPSAMYLWNQFSRSLIDQRRRYDADGFFAKDLTRSLVYAALEMFLDRKGKPGRQCLMKAICDAAEHPIERNSVFDEIVHLVLTPNENESDLDYVQAKHAGKHGADCAELYRDCRTGDGLLDNISKIL